MGDIEKKKDWRPWRRRDGLPPGYRPGPFAAIYAGLLAAGLAAAAVVYYVLVHDVPGMAKDRADTLKTALLVIGGSGALAGLYVSYRKQRTDEANHLRDQDKLFTERYTQAAAQLGSTAAAVRLAGVYALARIADDSERDRTTCLEVLCAYLRMPYDPDTAEPAERQVRTTAQTAIGKRLHPDHPGFWAGAEVDLSGAHLIDLGFSEITADTFIASGATFAGETRFEGATFRGVASFHKATFNGYVGFLKAMFGWATVFVGATFDVAAFGGATFGKDARFDGTAFGGDVWFEGTTFSGDVRFDGATFSERATFAGARFSGNAAFGGVTFNGDAGFSGATFSERAGFSGATFSGVAGFDGATFSRADPPAWPVGFAEPAGILWERDPADPPASSFDPGPLAGPADPPSAP